MAPPIGNRFWERRSSHGRNPIFATSEELWKACVEYFEDNAAHPLVKPIIHQGELQTEGEPVPRAMTMAGLCIFLDIGESTWSDYKHKDDFSAVVRKVEMVMFDQKFTGAAAGMLNSNIIARDLGLVDRKDNISSDGSMTPKSPSLDASKLSMDTLKELLAAREAQKTEE